MNKETINISLTPQEADSVAHVLMSALRRISMLDRERKDSTAVANELFDQLDYGHGCDAHGERTEWTQSMRASKIRLLAEKIGLEVGESKEVEIGPASG